MVRYVPTIGFCCLLLWVSTACTPKNNEPAALSEHGYRVSMHVSDTLIYLGAVDPRRRPLTSEVVVRVRDAQGQPVDGIAVVFSVEPSWTQNASLIPAETLTRNGKAHTIFQANTTGVVHVMARADNVTRVATITVASRPSPPDNSSWMVPSWPGDRVGVAGMQALAHTGQ
jgi:hypothetical protein